MTCREKWQIDNPGREAYYMMASCPSDYDYAKDPDNCSAITCCECWNREVDQELDALDLIDEICEARKKFIDAGFSNNEAFTLVWDIFKGRWENVQP